MKLFDILFDVSPIKEDLKGLARPTATFRLQPDRNKKYKTWYPTSRTKEDKETWARDQAIARHNERISDESDKRGMGPSKKGTTELKKKRGMETFTPSSTFLRPPPREGSKN